MAEYNLYVKKRAEIDATDFSAKELNKLINELLHDKWSMSEINIVFKKKKR